MHSHFLCIFNQVTETKRDNHTSQKNMNKFWVNWNNIEVFTLMQPFELLATNLFFLKLGSLRLIAGFHLFVSILMAEINKSETKQLED